jgi:hypothetical protein
LESRPPEGLVTNGAAVGVVAVPDELLGLALTAEPERLVGEQLVGGEAVVQLDDLHVLRAEPAWAYTLPRRLLAMS